MEFSSPLDIAHFLVISSIAQYSNLISEMPTFVTIFLSFARVMPICTSLIMQITMFLNAAWSDMISFDLSVRLNFQVQSLSFYALLPGE